MNNSKGITLIALVITIVILIILAGVVISLSIGENGIFNKAKFATEEYSNSQETEKIEISELGNEIDIYSSNRTSSSQKLEITIPCIKGTIFNKYGGNFWTQIDNLEQYKKITIDSRTRDSVAGTTYYIIRGFYDENGTEQTDEILKTTDISVGVEEYNIEKYKKIEFAVECVAAASTVYNSNYSFNNVKITN